MGFSDVSSEVVEQLQLVPMNGEEKSSSAKPFIKANTIDMSLSEIKDQHIIPVWSASNEPLISHYEFVDNMWHVVKDFFKDEKIFVPSIRVSHPIKGRIPEAKHKTASELEPWEQTIYYERMMFVIEIGSLYEEVNGNRLNLMVGGVKSYSSDNIHGKRPSGEQNFKLFIGFQNKVCCNLCVWTDGILEEVKARHAGHLVKKMIWLLSEFVPRHQLENMKSLTEISLAESEFAKILGRSRMYLQMPDKYKLGISPMLYGDQQLGSIAHSYYHDKNFGKLDGGAINLWNLYNLITGANKSSYIDTFLSRGANATNLVNEIMEHKKGVRTSWYLS